MGRLCHLPIKPVLQSIRSCYLKICEQHTVRTYLVRRGLKKSDLSKFVEEAVRKEVLRETVREIHEQNVDVSEQEIEGVVEEATAWARANRP